MRIRSKRDLVGYIPGIESYVPGSPDTINKHLPTSSGTSTGTPTMVVVENIPNAGYDATPWMQDSYADLRISSNNHMTLRRCTEITFSKDTKRILALSPSELEDVDLPQLIKEFDPRELEGVPSLIESSLQKIKRTLPSIQSNIRFVFTVGEQLSARVFNLIKTTFPHAEIITEYGMSELPWYFAFNTVRNIEDKDTYYIRQTSPCKVWIDSPDEEGFGEIIIDTSPIGPYRSGDCGKLENVGERLKLTIRGRIGYDVVNCLGARFISSVLEQKLMPYMNLIDDYLIVVEENNSTSKAKVVSYVTLKKSADPASLRNDLLTSLKDMRISKKKTLLEIEQSGIYEQTSIIFTDSIPRKGKKRYHLIKETL